MNMSAEDKIIKFIDKDNITKEESLELLEEFYWTDWDILNKKYPDYIEKIFVYLRKDNFSNGEIALIIKLYNNPHGAYVDEFSDIILDLYQKDKTKFIKALNMEKEEITNLVYLFRNHDVVIDEDEELLSIIQSAELTEEEKDTGNQFVKMYERVCNT
ncbi:MAG: hypothetical protein GX787_03320 [Tissierellia bacterium]|nr:hypothetical protein [Tissierellia bacterium]